MTIALLARPDALFDVESWLESAGWDVARSPIEHPPRRISGSVEAAIVAMTAGDAPRALDWLRATREGDPKLPIIAIGSNDEADLAIRSFRAGATDYLTGPCTRTELLGALGRAGVERGPSPAATELDRLVGRSEAMQDLKHQLRRVAPTDVSVLILGESGVGKEVCANAIHRLSRRADAPFVAVNCGAIPPSLQDSELFGHEKGAYTGANERREGIFERAQGGTVMLDEVAELSASVQVRLLRVLQNRELVRLGGREPVRLDLRVVSATNRDLRSEVEAGRFRQDLYFRLAVYPLYVPPLRDRAEDIPLLVGHILRRRSRLQARGLTPEAMAALLDYHWPGNVRELENVLQRAAVNAGSALITPEHLPPEVLSPPSERTAPEVDLRGVAPHTGVAITITDASDGSLEHLEREAIVAALLLSNGRVVAAAKRLGVSRTTLYRKMRAYGIEPKQFREETIRDEDHD